MLVNLTSVHVVYKILLISTEHHSFGEAKNIVDIKVLICTYLVQLVACIHFKFIMPNEAKTPNFTNTTCESSSLKN